jgi:hypothetical protein
MPHPSAENEKALARAMLEKLAVSEKLLAEIRDARTQGLADPADRPKLVERHKARLRRLYQDDDESEVGVSASVAAQIEAAMSRDVLSCREELVEKAIAAYLQGHPRGAEGLPKDWQTTLALAEQQVEGRSDTAFRETFVSALAAAERAERDQVKTRERTNDRERGE